MSTSKISLVIALLAISASARADVFINEVLGSTEGSDREYIELYNSGPGAVDISGWQLELWDSDAGGSFGGADGGSPYVIPAATSIASGGYYLLANATAETEYSVTADQSLPANAIENGSYTIILRDNLSSIVDSIFVTDGGGGDMANDAGVVIAPGGSIGPDGANLPPGFYRAGDGSSTLTLLEFTNPAASATPGAANLGPPPLPAVFINEVLASTLSNDREFIELYSADASPVDISGWQIELWDSDIGGTFGGADGSSPYVIPLASSIAPGGFYLLANADAVTEYALTPDLGLPANAIENSSFTIILRDTLGQIIDSAFVTDGAPGDQPNDAGVPLATNGSIGPDGTQMPPGFYRIGDGGAALALLEFANPAPSATPDAPNPSPNILILEVADGCQGQLVEVELWMRNLGQNVTGYQAFLEFDNALLNYRGDLSSYSPSPFPQHVQTILAAEVGTGQINVDGSDVFDGTGTNADSLLATLVFEVLAECDATVVEFRPQAPFLSELSFQGSLVPTTLFASRSFFLDYSAPTIVCDAVDAQVDANCEATVPFSATITDNCCMDAAILNLILSADVPGGIATAGVPQVSSITQDDAQNVTITGTVAVSDLTDCPAIVEISIQASDCCGHLSTVCVAMAEVSDAIAPDISCPATIPLQCLEEIPPPATNLAEFLGIGGTASDNCGVVEVNFTNQLQAGAGCPADPMLVARTYVAQDPCGNTKPCKHVFEIADSTAPVLTCPADITIQCGESTLPANTGQATATDNCAAPPVVTYLDRNLPGSCDQEEMIIRTWTAVDACGNFATSCVQNITVEDTTAPDIAPCPDDIVVNADAGGCNAVVTYTAPTATDNCDPAPLVSCDIASGATFPAGTTQVTCTATDNCGNQSLCTFDVTVNSLNDVQVEVELVGVSVPVSRCIHFITDDCGSTGDAELSFVDHDGDDANMNGIIDATEGGANTPSTPVRAIDTVEVPCGNWTQLCAKDEQHTFYDSSTLADSGSYYTANTLLSLRGGDTDNDGDVDINDVTFLVLTFGSLTADGGCPWDGVTRDADFSNNGAVGTEDYTFLTANFLQISGCACSNALVGPGPGPKPGFSLSVSAADLPAEVAAAADLNADGLFNHQDVRIFETRHNLGHSLSQKLRAADLGSHRVQDGKR